MCQCCAPAMKPLHRVHYYRDNNKSSRQSTSGKARLMQLHQGLPVTRRSPFITSRHTVQPADSAQDATVPAGFNAVLARLGH